MSPGGRALAGVVDRRAALIEAATAIVRERGFAAASVKAITAGAGVSTGLLYTYAPSAQDLLAEVFRRCAGQELAATEGAVAHAARATPGSAAAQLVAVVDTFAGRALRAPRLAWALLAEPVGRLIETERLNYRRGYCDLLGDVVEQGIATGELPRQSAHVTAAGLVGAIGEALVGPLSPAPDSAEYDGTQLTAAIRNLCLRAVGATLIDDAETEGTTP
jgi:AcrR family transcriptional regulator